MTNKKVIYQDIPIENARKSVGTIEKLRNRDTDGDEDAILLIIITINLLMFT